MLDILHLLGSHIQDMVVGGCLEFYQTGLAVSSAHCGAQVCLKLVVVLLPLPHNAAGMKGVHYHTQEIGWFPELGTEPQAL